MRRQYVDLNTDSMFPISCLSVVHVLLLNRYRDSLASSSDVISDSFLEGHHISHILIAYPYCPELEKY